ncbi:hypothetical protein D3C81_1411770 [compost metagenome]
MHCGISNVVLTAKSSVSVTRKVDYQLGQCLVKAHAVTAHVELKVIPAVKVHVVERVDHVAAHAAKVQVAEALVVKAKDKAKEANQVKATAAVEAVLAVQVVITTVGMDVNRVVKDKAVVVVAEIRADEEVVKLFFKTCMRSSSVRRKHNEI